MVADDASTARHVTLREAIDDLGWVWLSFTAAVNAPSLLSLLQMVFEHRFIDALQWIVDGYNDLLEQLSQIAEPHLLRVLSWLNALTDWRFQLHPHWRAIFVLALLLPSSAIRVLWRERQLLSAVGASFVLGSGALVSAILVGVIPLDASWWRQGLAAFIPTVFLVFTGGLLVFAGGAKSSWTDGFLIAGMALLIGALVSAFAVAMSGVNLLARGAGLMTFGYFLLIYGGLPALFGGNRFTVRMQLTVLGGFLAAGAIAAADAIVRLLQASH